MNKQLAFYSPEPKGRVTGGFLYNQRLLEQLQTSGWQSDLVTRGDVDHEAPVHIVDSLLAVDYMKKRDMKKRDMKNSEQPHKALFLYHLPPFAGQSVPEDWLNTERCLLEQGRIVVTGTQCYELLMARHRISEAKLQQLMAIITPGIADNWQIKTEFAALPKELLVLSAVTPQKGIKAVVEVLTELRQHDWTCRIYGETQQDPDFYQSMLDRVTLAGLSQRIVFAGTIAPDDVNDVMCSADLLLNFSQFETYSMVTAEAIATGLPVLSTPVGELTEFQQASNILHLNSHAFTEQHLQLQRLLTDTNSYSELCYAHSDGEVKTVKSWAEAARQWLALIQNMGAKMPAVVANRVVYQHQSAALQGAR